MKLILCEDSPDVLGMDQDSWVARQHNEREPLELVDMSRTLREFNLAFWMRVSPVDVTRIGRTTSAARNPWTRCCGCWPATTFRT